jgi:hypothetical protein
MATLGLSQVLGFALKYNQIATVCPLLPPAVPPQHRSSNLIELLNYDLMKATLYKMITYVVHIYHIFVIIIIYGVK